ncbi:hypothetical protein [Methylomonas koyamae]|uniref:hypothetical protein n=1 Tax=Methylomonas koyamae TaxID=702114 RepID=UPI000AA3A900
MIYALSAPLRDAIETTGATTLWLDLLPDRSPENIAERLAKPRGKDSLSNHLRKRLAIDGVKTLLLRETLPAAELSDPAKLAAALKALPIVLHRPRPIAEASAAPAASSSPNWTKT